VSGAQVKTATCEVRTPSISEMIFSMSCG